MQQIWPQPWYSPGDLDPIAGDSPEVRSVYFGLYKKEPRLNAAIEGKVASIATQEITITAADEDRPQDVEAAQFIDSAIKTSNQSWVTLIVSLLRPGCIFGWAVNEIKMRPIRHGRFQNKWGLEHIRSLNTEPFLKVQLDTFRNIYGLVNLVRGIQDYKPEKFVWYANKPLFGNPFGQSDVQPAERAVRLFREAYQVWYVALKRYSLPYMHGKVDDPNQRAMLEAALKDIQGTGWAVTGKEDEITVLNMAAAAAISGFEAMIDKVSEDIFFAVRGSSTPSQPSSNKGGDVRHDTETSKKTGSDPIEQLIAEEVCLSINRWLIPRLMEPNFPPDVGMPIATLANVDMEWVKDRLDVLKAVEDSGRKVSSKLWFKTANAKPADPNDPLDAQALAASQGPQGGPGAGGAGQPGVPESPPPGGPAGASGGPGASPGGPDDSGSPAPKLPGGGGATPNVAPAGGGSSETQSPPATAAAPSSDDNAGNDDDAPTVPPELIAAMLQAKIDGDHQAVDRLAEMGADPEELAEFMADREGGTQGMVGTQAFAGLVKRFSMFAADARSDTPKVAGLAVRAADTGRLLMLQRADSPDDPAAGKWEFPGGHIKVGESPEKAAFREWCEETGHVFDAGRGVQKPQDRWTAPNGYTLFFTEVPDESKIIEANPREQSESLAWIDPDDLDHPDVREELRNELPQISRLLRGQQPLKTFGWFSDPSPKSKSRATNSDTGAHAYGEQARRLLAHQGREDRGEPHPKTTKQVLQEHKASMEPKREEARKAYRFAIADPTSVRPKQLKALAEHLHALTRDEVRQNLRELEHKTFGKLKHELVDALLKHVESRSAENAEALKKMKDAAAADDGFGFGMDEMFGGPRAGDAGVKMRDKKTHEDRMKERNIVAREHGPGRVDTGSVRHIGPIPHQEAVPHNPSERESVQPIDRPDELPDAIGRPATKPIPMPAAAHVTKPPKGESPTPEERDEAMRAAADIKPPAQPPDDIDREQDAAAVAHRDRMEDWQRDKPDSLAAEEAAGRAQGRVDAARSQEPAAVSPEKPSPPGGKPLNVPKDPRRLTIDQADQALEALGYTEVRRVGGDTGSPDDHGVVVARGPDGQEHEMRPADVKRAIYGEGVMPTAAKLNSQDLSNLFTQTGRGKLLGAAKMENGKVVSWKVKSPDGGADLV
ncbi:MAG TPA: NUDIX domain-containing protein, partial [Urbifossiella sp.]|nr:NUDIX domain-containing protein [Urbifossiella sp.]